MKDIFFWYCKSADFNINLIYDIKKIRRRNENEKTLLGNFSGCFYIYDDWREFCRSSC